LPLRLLSTLDGTVTHAGYPLDGANNTYIIIENNEWQVGYMHPDETYVVLGQHVLPGEPIGLMGDIGQSSWTHVHYWILDKRTGKNVSDQSQFWNVSSTVAPKVEENSTVQSVGELPFLNDESQTTASFFGHDGCNDIGDIRYIVWHQIAVGSTGTPVEGMDGTRLASAFKNGKGWDRPGYHFLITDVDAGNGYVRVDQIWPTSCYSYGVAQYTNTDGSVVLVNTYAINMSYVDNPTGSPPSESQLKTMLTLSMSLKQKYPNATVLGHKEIPQQSRSDPVGVDMNQIRAQIDSGSIAPDYTVVSRATNTQTTTVSISSQPSSQIETVVPGSSFTPVNLSTLVDPDAQPEEGLQGDLSQDGWIVESVEVIEETSSVDESVKIDLSSPEAFIKSIPVRLRLPLIIGVLSLFGIGIFSATRKKEKE